MKLFIKEKLISFHNRYFIYNEKGEQVYELVSKYFSVGNKTKLLDMDGKELVYVEQELFHLKPVYLLYIEGEFISTIKKKYFVGLPVYEAPELNLKVEGNLLSTEYNIIDESDNIIANAKRKYISIGDKYQLEIYDEKNYLNILGILIAIINVIDERQSNN